MLLLLQRTFDIRRETIQWLESKYLKVLTSERMMPVVPGVHGIISRATHGTATTLTGVAMLLNQLLV